VTDRAVTNRAVTNRAVTNRAVTKPSLLVLTVGGFGDRVGERLAQRYPDAVLVDAVAGTHPATWPSTDVMVLAAEYDHPELFEAVEWAAFAWRRPWFPVLLDHPYLRCGPVVIPSRTACHRCFRRRRRQHAKTPRIWDEYRPPAVAGSADRVRGYAGYHIGLAAGLAIRAVSDALEPAGTGVAAPAWVRTIGLVDGAPHRAGVTPVDGCDRCRPPRAGRDWLAVATSVDTALGGYPAPVEPNLHVVASRGGNHGW
jgi:bacteriocin biosynthesis cyclodehydratase domain-containing protein